MADIPDNANVVIIGGGVIGLSVAYHLGKRGANDIVLLERHQLTSGTSWHAAGIVGPLRASMNLTKLAVYATQLFEAIQDETGQHTGYKQTGGFWLANDNARMTELKRIAAIGELTGVEAELLGPAEIKNRYPMLNTHDLVGALWVASDGQVNPVDICMAYAKGARANGVEIFENSPVKTVHERNAAVSSVELDCGRIINCGKVINCAGVWAAQLGRRSNVAIPLQAVEHMYVVTEPIASLPQPCPVVRDLDGRIYIKEDAGRLVIGGFEARAKIFAVDANGPDPAFIELPEDWEQFEPFMTAALNRIPELAHTGIQHFMNGPESFVPDTKQLMGEVPECRNYFVAAGMNSIGIMSSAGIGRTMADWLIDGEAPMDLWEVDVARFEPDMATPHFVKARVREAVANQFEMHWPNKQFNTGRDVRRTPLHEFWRQSGAVFGSPAGWERPLWFAANNTEAEFRYSYGDQCWWPAAARECKAAMERAVLLELSPFSKIDVIGKDATNLMQHLCANDVDVEPGRLVYTQMLNDRGGIESDGTVARIAEHHFRFTGGAPTRRKDLTWIGRHAETFARADVSDVTTQSAVIGLMGPRAADVLAAATGADMSGQPSGTIRKIEIAGIAMAAWRVSFIGEFGWELTPPWDQSAQVLKQLHQVGAKFGLAPMGLFAIDCCRMEKAYRHWGHDIGPENTPFEVGLGFAVSLDKTSGFIGREAIEKHKQLGLTRRLFQFAVEGAHPLLLHDEPIYRGGKLIGHTTSGAHGFRTDLSLCMGYLPMQPGETRADVAGDRLEIAIAGQRFPLKLLKNAPYDPTGARMHRPGGGDT